jgi:FdhE protein
VWDNVERDARRVPSLQATEAISDRANEAETCDKCRGYLRIFYQVQDPTLEPLADGVATLGLDMLMAEAGWKRGGQNPFPMGY